MPKKSMTIPLLPDHYYHVYNRGNNGEPLFMNDYNYAWFLKMYKAMLDPFVDTSAYCIMPNHFHFLIKVKWSEREDISKIVSNQFRKLFISYALMFNAQEQRRGALFSRCFNRIEIKNMAYLKHLIFYIHSNPQKHGIIKDFRQYKYSSFKSFFSDKIQSKTNLEVLDWFNGDIQEFAQFQSDKIELRSLKKLFDEE